MATRDIKAAYIEAYRRDYDTAVAQGRRGRAAQLAGVLAEYGVKVVPPMETTAQAAPETTEAKPPKVARKATSSKQKKNAG